MRGLNRSLHLEFLKVFLDPSLSSFLLAIFWKSDRKDGGEKAPFILRLMSDDTEGMQLTRIPIRISTVLGLVSTRNCGLRLLTGRGTYEVDSYIPSSHFVSTPYVRLYRYLKLTTLAMTALFAVILLIYTMTR